MNRSRGAALAFSAMRSSPAYVPTPPQGEGNCGAESLKPWAAFPMCAAFPRSEYCAALRLLPARLPPFGLASRVGHTLSRRWEASRVPSCPDFRHAALLDPAEVTVPLPLRALVIAFRFVNAVGPRSNSVHEAELLHPCGLRPGRRAVYASGDVAVVL